MTDVDRQKSDLQLPWTYAAWARLVGFLGDSFHKLYHHGRHHMLLGCGITLVGEAVRLRVNNDQSIKSILCLDCPVNSFADYGHLTLCRHDVMIPIQHVYTHLLGMRACIA